MHHFVWGGLAIGCLTAALLFLRFWHLTRERLFVFFALGFTVFAANWTWIALSVAAPDIEVRHYMYYMPRLAAFSLIIVGILDKNRRGK
jgi:hypothetical protein